MSLISGDVIRDFDVEEVETACKLYSCDKLHLSQSTASCDGVSLVVKFCLLWIYATRFIRLDHDHGGSFF